MQELKKKGFSQYKVSKPVEEGRLIILNKSYYENTGYCGDESDFYYTEVYAPNGVICLLSAAVYHNLTTYIPDAIPKSKLAVSSAKTGCSRNFCGQAGREYTGCNVVNLRLACL